MRYFWWIVGLVVVACVVLMMKFAFKPHIFSLISPSSISGGASQAAVVVGRQLQGYLEQRKVVVIGLPKLDPKVPGQVDLTATFMNNFLGELIQFAKVNSLWILKDSFQVNNSSLQSLKIHYAKSFHDSASEIKGELAKDDSKILILTDLIDTSAATTEPINDQSLIYELRTQIPFDRYMILNIAPVRALKDETLPPEFHCLENASNLCATDVPDAVEFASLEMTKSSRIDRHFITLSLEQRSTSQFALYIHLP